MIALSVASIAAMASIALTAATGPAAVRTVVIHADSSSNADYALQARALLDSADGLKERDMIVVSMIGTETGKVLLGRDLHPRTQSPSASKRPNRTMFYVTLIGKDGQEKFKSEKPVDPEVLFSLVDGMPMRRQEMRRTR